MIIKFISQLLLFIEFAHRKKLPSSARMLWIGIFLCANKLAQKTGKRNIWPTGFFPESNAEITISTGLDDRTIRKYREILKMHHLIDYKKGDGKKFDPSYKINYLKMTGFEIVPDYVSDDAFDDAPDNATDDADDHACVIPAIESKNDPDNVFDFLQMPCKSNGSGTPDSDSYTEPLSQAGAGFTGISTPQGLVDISKVPLKGGLVYDRSLKRRSKS